MKHYHQQRWDDAEKCFKEADGLRSKGDPPSKVYLERIEHFREEPPPQGWDGVYEFKTN